MQGKLKKYQIKGLKLGKKIKPEQLFLKKEEKLQQLVLKDCCFTILNWTYNFKQIN